MLCKLSREHSFQQCRSNLERERERERLYTLKQATSLELTTAKGGDILIEMESDTVPLVIHNVRGAVPCTRHYLI